MRVRCGRKQPQNLYVQLGDVPSDRDEYIGVIFDEMRAEVLIKILNGEAAPFSTATCEKRQDVSDARP